MQEMEVQPPWATELLARKHKLARNMWASSDSYLDSKDKQLAAGRMNVTGQKVVALQVSSSDIRTGKPYSRIRA